MIPSRSRVLRLPAAGKLFICTDLHGNLRDFKRMAEIFEEAHERADEPFLLFTGDLIHGPNLEPEEWPTYLGVFYRDESGELMERYLALEARYPGKVACLLGNHEHSHIGGPHTPKFWEDETVHFERSVGPRRARRYLEAFERFPLVAVSRCGVAATHAAPSARITSLADLDTEYAGFENLDINMMYDIPVIGHLLWSRACPPPVARAFLDVLGDTGSPHDVVVFGHEIVGEGFERIGAEQLQLSTSFGVDDDCKYFLEIDLASRYRSTHQLVVGRELRRLYPDPL